MQKLRVAPEHCHYSQAVCVSYEDRAYFRLEFLQRMKQSLFWLLLLINLATAAPRGAAQKKVASTPETLPLDPAVRSGTLPNGLRYYILKNSKPEKRVEMRLAVNAGSCQEDDDQLGLAHFCEHMAFNGTRHFKKNQLVDFLESVGTKFGPHLNAYTSFDETVYMLRVPTDTAGVVDKALDILADWAGGLAFDPEEVEKERGVVVEEWRLGQGADERMRQKYWPVIFGGTRYGERLPIGKKEILETFPHEALKRFYADWYRPDLMAVAIVGDIDPAAIEQRVKELFGALRNPAKPRRREPYAVPPNSRLQAAVARDPEAMYNAVQFIYMTEKRPLKTEADYRRKLIYDVMNGMLNQRFSDLAKKPDSPFLFGYAGSFDFLRNNSAFFGVMIPKTDKDVAAVEALATELKRLQRHGFTEAEFKRQIADMLKEAETAYNERDKRESDKLAMGLVAHYLQGQPFMAPERTYELKKKILSSLTLNDIKAALPEYLSRLAYPKIVSMGAEKEGQTPPTEQDLAQAFEKAMASEPEPWQEMEVSDKLLAEIPAKGMIRVTRTVPGTDIKEYVLANGARVFFKKTDFKNDELLLSAVSQGGLSMYDDGEKITAELVDAMAAESGVGEFDAATLEKMLKGKNLSLQFYIVSWTEGFSGRAAVSDAETLLQLLHLYFRAPRIDETGENLALEREKTFLKLKANDPAMVFEDSVFHVYYRRHPRTLPRTAESLARVNPARAQEILRERLANPGDFYFMLVGNVEEEKIADWIATYLASLPGSRERETYKDRGVRPAPGRLEKTVERGVDPKSQVRLMMHGSVPYTAENRWQARAAASLLAIRLREVLREDKGGVYYVRCSSNLQAWPEPIFESVIEFSCDPQRVDELVNETRRVIKETKEKGADAANLQKVRETLRRELETDLKTNEWWLRQMEHMALYQETFFDVEAYRQWLENLKGEDFKNWVARYFNENNEALFILKPQN